MLDSPDAQAYGQYGQTERPMNVADLSITPDTWLYFTQPG